MTKKSGLGMVDGKFDMTTWLNDFQEALMEAGWPGMPTVIDTLAKCVEGRREKEPFNKMSFLTGVAVGLTMAFNLKRKEAAGKKEREVQ